MSSKRTILIETALVVGVLTTGIAAAGAAHAAPVMTAVQSSASKAAPDPRRNVIIESVILIERAEQDANGEDKIKLYRPGQIKVVPGDRLLFTNSYRNTGATPVTGFVVNNPVHAAVTFSGVDEKWAVVSVDGGKSYGKLSALTVANTENTNTENPEGQEVANSATRPARPADVTHIRWTFTKPIAPGQSGDLHFRGIVK